MNKKQILAIVIAIGSIVAIAASVLFVRYKGVFPSESTPKAAENIEASTEASAEDGAEIELEEGATGFACSCGCSTGNEMEDCQCKMCAENEDAEKSEKYYYKDFETGEMKEISVDTVLTVMDEEAVGKLIEKISECDTLCIRRCESEVTDNRTDDPSFHAISESRYYYDALTGKVYNAEGEEITSSIKFSINGCKDCFDFLERYFAYKGISSDFVTDDLSHTKDLLLGQRVYSFGTEECEEITYLESKMDGIMITEEDCTYQVKTYEDGEDRIMYVTITAAGADVDGYTVVRYITYILDYNPTIPGEEAVS